MATRSNGSTSTTPPSSTAERNATGVSRRGFVAAGSAAAAALSVSVARGANAGGSDRLKVGLVGCGGRGSGAASQAMSADPGVVLWSIADAFPDRAESGAGILQRVVEEKAAADPTWAQRFDVSADRRFTGLDGYKQVIET